MLPPTTPECNGICCDTISIAVGGPPVAAGLQKLNYSNRSSGGFNYQISLFTAFCSSACLLPPERAN